MGNYYSWGAANLYALQDLGAENLPAVQEPVKDTRENLFLL